MAASTASMCLRRESLSVQAHISSQDCSRFKTSPSVDGSQATGIALGRRLVSECRYAGGTGDKSLGTDEPPVTCDKLKPDTYSLYETFMTPPGAFVCWTDLVASPATRMTLRSPVPPSRFSMRHERCRPFK